MTESKPAGRGRLVVSCPGCDEKYVVEASRIPLEGGQLTCRICGGRVTLPRRDTVQGGPEPLETVQASGAAQAAQGAAMAAEKGAYGVRAPAAAAAAAAVAQSEIRCPHCLRSFVPDNTDDLIIDPMITPLEVFRKTVLIVEDTEYFLRLALDALGAHYATVSARGPAEAIQAMQDGSVHLVVLDLTLEKEEDGLAVLSEASKRHLPCLIFTAKGEAEMWGAWSRLKELGASDLLLKGLNFEEQLVSKVEALLASSVA